MKLRAAALLLACPIALPLALAAPLHAAPGAAPVRAATPIELHIEAQAPVAADGADIQLAVTGNGKTDTEAMAQLKANRDALSAQLRELGIDPAGLIFTRNTQNEEMISQARSAAMSAAAPEPEKKKKKSAEQDADAASQDWEPFVFRQEDVTIRFANVEQAQKLVNWTTSRGDAFVLMSAKSSISDPAKARRAAREQAIANARKDAEDYAGALGYRVVRMVRVSNARPPLNMPDMVQFFTTLETSGFNRSGDMQLMQSVETVSIDFLIAPN